MSFYRRILALAACFISSAVQAFTILPADGLWGIVSEQTLAVGRAFVLETSTNITVATFYNYNASGAPTFYVGGGTLNAANSVSVLFSEPQGGTCLGCTPRSGFALSTPGTALFEFTSSTTGFVTLPREARKAIAKGSLAWTNTATGLLGGWAFTYLTTTTGVAFADFGSLTTILSPTSGGNGLVSNGTATIGCENQVSGVLAGYVVCVKITSLGSTDKTMLVKMYGNQMDGIWMYNGLTTQYVFTGRRILSASGNQNTIKVMPTETPDQSRVDMLRAAIAQAVADVAAN